MQMIRFRDDEHEQFYHQMLNERKCNDSYHRALFYTLGIAHDTRNHIRDLFDFSNGGIKPEGLSAAWQTGSSARVSRLAFNLWNGWSESGGERYSMPHELFDCNYALYFFEAIRLRYPEYCRGRAPVFRRTESIR
ncbi:DUF6075 family protein [Paenibacillus sp. J5C_2022]|uniref:DUF6075 family protein n=1 Tax=Paenibacillus sp. J5C2022 TaxID=2977129 RepID=UPI0021D2AC1C|nr:DUF6075 family protein [Paenibacillus sp. J5C2022]MCU6711553.1 DUF6075 family protein [Paenibacillus sp. J5C2022]